MTADSGHLAQFSVDVRYSSTHVVVAVFGDVDTMHASDLGHFLEALVDQGHTRLVMDLEGLDFIDASGVRVIGTTARRLTRLGGILLLRSASRMTRRVLDMTEIAGLVTFEAEPPVDEITNRLTLMGRSNDREVDPTFELLAALTTVAVDGADGTSVSLMRHRRLTTVAASDETIAQMDRDQYATGQGPCLSAAEDGHQIDVDSLDGESRWPEFIVRAADAGIGSILSTPLKVLERPIGALNIYSRSASAFGPRERDLASLFAHHASEVAAGATTDDRADDGAASLRRALIGRERIAHAQGVLMERLGLTAEDASTHLRRESRRREISVVRLAAELLLPDRGGSDSDRSRP